MVRAIASMLAAGALLACGSGGGAGAGESDGGTTADGGASAGPGCGAHPNALFCDDFEAPQPLDVDWAPIGSSEFAFPSIETSTSAYSPSHVMRATADATDAGNGSAFCEADHRLTTATAATVRFAVSFRVPAFPVGSDGGVGGGATDAIVQLSAQPSGAAKGGFQLSVAVGPAGVQLSFTDAGQGAPPVTPNPATLGPLQPGQWVRLELAIALTGSPGVTADLAGGVLGAAMPFHVTPSTYSGGYAFQLGLLTSASSPLDGSFTHSAVEFDDVVFEQ